MKNGLENLVGMSSGYLESLPSCVRSRLAYLDKLQEDYDAAEDELNEEIKALEKKYKPVFDKLVDLRRRVVTGETDAPEEFKTDEVVDVEQDGNGESAENEDVKGIPDFWLVALSNCQLLDEMIQQKDAEILGHLSDIRCEDIMDDAGDEEGYKLVFTFDDNEYFTNKELTLRIDASMDQGMMNVDTMEGTKILWKSDSKNPTIKVMKKKPKPGQQNKRPVVKKEKIDSFFNLFSPPDLEGLEGLDEEEAEEIQEVLERSLAIGELLREDIIPHAVHWFTGEACEDDSEDEEDFSDEDSSDGESEGSDEDSDDASDADGDAPAVKPVDADNPECKQQ